MIFSRLLVDRREGLSVKKICGVGEDKKVPETGGGDGCTSM